MSKKKPIRVHPHPCLKIYRTAFRDDKLVYIACANKKIKYQWGKSSIAYIGTTKKGAKRVASSAAVRGEALLYTYGIKYLEFHIVTCGKVPGVATWRKLERALLIRFKEKYGGIPEANKSGALMKWKDELRYFSQEKIDSVIEKFS